MAEQGNGTAAGASAQATAIPPIEGFSHISMPTRDIAEAYRFWMEVGGAESVFFRPPRFAEVRFGGIVLGFAPRTTGWTGYDAEYPHYGFAFAPDDMLAMKARLEAYGVPTPRIWTRHGAEALMYFRDPSGNLFELYCTEGMPQADQLPVGAKAGGDYAIDFGALNYRWQPPAAVPPAVAARQPRPLGLNHMTLPVRDIPQALRFWTTVLGAKPGKVAQQVDIGGITLSFNEQPGGWTGWDEEFPHYAFFVSGEAMRPLEARLAAHGVPTNPVWTRNQVEALMYFRDPSGNLFELYCPQGLKDADKLPRGVAAGGDYAVDLAALNYQWEH
jgi:catechol 2,3-dioxygenase-like lactoylglutathione lyase family enzyme